MTGRPLTERPGTLDLRGVDCDTLVPFTTPANVSSTEDPMSLLRALFVAFFKPFATATAVKGGSGHYNEQCHPQTYG